MSGVHRFMECVLDRPAFREGFCDFNGNQQIIGRKRRFNKKYFVYSKETGKPFIDQHAEKMEILDVVHLENEMIVFFADSRCRVSFIRTRESEVPLHDVLDRLERAPVFKNILFGLFSHLYFLGVMRFPNGTFTEEMFSFGYDKKLDYKIRFLFPARIRRRFSDHTNRLALFVHLYYVRIPFRDIYNHYLETSDINTPVYVKLLQKETEYVYNMKAHSRHRYGKRHYLFNTRSYRLRGVQAELFVRKSVTAQYVIVVTSPMPRSIAAKEWLAQMAVAFVPGKEKHDIYFEKFATGASESAFELFKYASERGEPCFYILKREHTDYARLKAEYGKRLLAHNSFLSFLRIFQARSFISSDLVSHIQRRLYDNDRLIKKKILACRRKIFLQHGVCLATNIFERGYFNRKVPIAPDYIVVNSQYEKNLFLEHTSYRKEQLMLTGLPNLDLYAAARTKEKSAITFMLTWRPWDLTGQLETSSYLGRYLSFLETVQNDPFYQDKQVHIILHPKSKLILQEQFPDVYEKYAHFFYEGDIKDALLASKVLVSDYSSIVYFAFTGGSNVIFYWEDKDRAEREYGAPNILQEDIAFGDIAMNMDEVHQLITERYAEPQSIRYKQRFEQLVECHEGMNTERTFDHIYRYILGNDPLPEETESEYSSERSVSVN